MTQYKIYFNLSHAIKTACMIYFMKGVLGFIYIYYT